jgi:AhpD family alkylhydroperoxidase
MEKDYVEYHRHLGELIRDLQHEIPGAVGGFGQMRRGALAEGAVSTRTKELIALAISIAVHCDGCIAYHVHDAMTAGATPNEIAEVIGVALLMGGGPALMYGAEALEAVRQFEAQAGQEANVPDRAGS